MGNGKYGDTGLPKWITPDPRWGDKGKVMYIEKWARDRWYPRLIHLVGVVGYFFVFIGILVVLGFFVRPLDLEDIFVLTFFSLFFLMLLVIMEIELLTMPFTIYEEGVTRREAGILDAILRRERFIHWSEIKDVEVKIGGWKVPFPYDIRLRYGKFRYILIGHWILVDFESRERRKPPGGFSVTSVPTEQPDCWTIMRLLERNIPDMLDDRSMKYLESKKGLPESEG